MNNRKFETKAIRIQLEKTPFKEHSVPLYETSSFVYNSAEEASAVFAEEQGGYIYSRFNNPNCDELIQKLCTLEGTETGIAASSGMAAIFLSIAGVLNAGDHIIASKNLFGTTHMLLNQVLPKWGISHTYADMSDMKSVKNALLPTTRLLYVETPSNPGLEIFDLEKLGKFTGSNDLYFVVDNCFATPYLQLPLKYGADFIVHSTTKFIDGQGRTIGGAVLGSKLLMKDIITLSRITGPVMPASTGWLLSKSLETLAVRMEKHCSNALRLAEFLENNQEILWVKYPFLKSHPQYRLARKQMTLGGALVSFELKGGMKRAMKFINALQLFSISSNLGDSRSIITHPATTTHSKLSAEERKDAGITDAMVRVSVGLENVSDLMEDLERAINKSKDK
ncbi:MAG: PLP-dependent transferase [Bacteroidales bacterium]|nr:PLP-dependent transferase [Bacteroidales bacterium]